MAAFLECLLPEVRRQHDFAENVLQERLAGDLVAVAARELSG
jgi:hypothetical protein